MQRMQNLIPKVYAQKDYALVIWSGYEEELSLVPMIFFHGYDPSIEYKIGQIYKIKYEGKNYFGKLKYIGNFEDCHYREKNALRSRCYALEDQIKELQEENTKLKQNVSDLEAKLRENSQQKIMPIKCML
jgi:hypothetical protein